jgi:hypothetical protein
MMLREQLPPLQLPKASTDDVPPRGPVREPFRSQAMASAIMPMVIAAVRADAVRRVRIPNSLLILSETVSLLVWRSADNAVSPMTDGSLARSGVLRFIAL